MTIGRTPPTRASSASSRAADIIGRAWLRYWPINDLGIISTPTYPDVPPAGSAFDPMAGLAILSFGLAGAGVAGVRGLRLRIG